MAPKICAYCMLHRHNNFQKIIENIKNNAGLQNIQFFAFSFRDSFGYKIKNNLEKNIDNLKITFIKKQKPKFIKEKDLFYNKKHLTYVKTSFPKSRINYCYMNNFVSEPSKIPYINNYELSVQFDDDIFFLKKIEFNYSSFIANKVKQIVTSHTHIDDILKRRETKIGLFEATRIYCDNKKIKPKHKQLADAIEENNIELFHQLPWTSCSFNIYKMSIFHSKEWQEWITYIKNTGSIFKDRWGDQEIIGTYAYIYFEDPIMNLDLKPDQFINKLDNEMIIYIEKNFAILSYQKLKLFIKKFINNVRN